MKMKSRNTKVLLFILVLATAATLTFYNFYFSNAMSLKRNIAEPDRIKIYYSGEEMIIDSSDKDFEDILRINKSRLVSPLTRVKFDVQNYVASNNITELSSKDNNGIEILKKSINMIEYLYDRPQEIHFSSSKMYEKMQYSFDKIYDKPLAPDVTERFEYTRILYTVTEGAWDFMAFGKEDLLFFGRGFIMDTSEELKERIDKRDQ